MKIYKAMICDKGSNPRITKGPWVSVLAKDLDDAEKKLEAKYGDGKVFCLHNEEDARRPR